MRVYAESNFVLELALEQESYELCEEILDLAESRAIALAIPAFALVEPFTTLEWRRRERKRLDAEVGGQLSQIGRTKSLSDQAVAASGILNDLMVRSAQVAAQRLRDVRARIVDLADVLPLSAPTFVKAEESSREYGLDSGDAIVLASVLLDPALGDAPSCFINRNTKDFGDDPSLVELLAARSCRLLDFGEGVPYIRAAVSGSPPPTA